MATTHAPEATARAATDYEAYSFVAELFSAGMAEGVKQTLQKLQDPKTFAQAVVGLAQDQGLDQDSVPDPTGLYNGFWSLYHGVDLGCTWLNDAGAPSRSALIVEQLEAVQKPQSLDNGQVTPMGGFGIGFGPISFGVDW
ncbi:hypothetical protein ACFWWC_34975 [Streptomyces sp. NPDC058642]|uniref:hypothetical protein n=1 Tax=Streptomyces sp. NPDC058642 TaxID=3346572 RepID=UPI00364950C3